MSKDIEDIEEELDTRYDEKQEEKENKGITDKITSFIDEKQEKILLGLTMLGLLLTLYYAKNQIQTIKPSKILENPQKTKLQVTKDDYDNSIDSKITREGDIIETNRGNINTPVTRIPQYTPYQDNVAYIATLGGGSGTRRLISFDEQKEYRLKRPNIVRKAKGESYRNLRVNSMREIEIIKIDRR